MTKEEYKYILISNIVNNKSNKKRASVHLNCCIRQVNRLIKRYKPGDNTCFRHGNAYKIPHNKTNSEIVKKIIELKQTKYKIFTITHFCEKLNDVENVKIKLVTLKRIFRTNKIITKSTRKSTIRLYENELKQLQSPNKTENIGEKVYQDLILCKDKQHCRISVEPLFGNIVEVDASEFIFFGDQVVHLHLFTDRATNKILTGYFDFQETLNGYRHAFMTLLTKYGAPMKLVSDYRGVFTVLRNKNDPENAKLTQFSYWCSKLGTDLYCTSISQKKPWVERAHRILQDRLTSEFSLHSDIDINKANELLPILLDEINKKLHYSEDGYDNVFEKFNSDVHGDINIFLSLRHTRKFASGSVISFNNDKYFAFDYQTKKIMNFMPYTPTLILLTYDNKILLNIRNKFYYAVKYDKYDKTKSTKHVTFPPKASHPWYQLNDFLIFKKQYRVTPNEIYEKVVISSSYN